MWAYFPFFNDILCGYVASKYLRKEILMRKFYAKSQFADLGPIQLYNLTFYFISLPVLFCSMTNRKCIKV